MRYSPAYRTAAMYIKKNFPRFESAKACTEVTIPLRVMKVPKMPRR